MNQFLTIEDFQIEACHAVIALRKKAGQTINGIDIEDMITYGTGNVEYCVRGDKNYSKLTRKQVIYWNRQFNKKG